MDDGTRKEPEISTEKIGASVDAGLLLSAKACRRGILHRAAAPARRDANDPQAQVDYV